MENKKFLSRRDFLKIGVTGASAVALASCAPKAEEPVAPSGGEEDVMEPSQEPVEINFLSWGDIADNPAWTQGAEGYQKLSDPVWQDEFAEK